MSGPRAAVVAAAAFFGLRVFWRALGRAWGRDVMLYVGVVSFFALLAVFPAVTILFSVYGLIFTPEQAVGQVAAVSHLMPYGAQVLLESELTRLANAPRAALSVQSAVAFVIGAYAAHRGFKALLAGLQFIHDEKTPRGFVGFNMLALLVAIAAFALLIAASGAFLTLQLVSKTLPFATAGTALLGNDWLVGAASLFLGLLLLYHFAMSSDPVPWRASASGAAAATALCLAASWASAIYFNFAKDLGAAYGSIGSIAIFLIWLSWNVNAVFVGGALATEAELVLAPKERTKFGPKRKPKAAANGTSARPARAR